MVISDEDLATIERWCARRVPEEAQHQVELKAMRATDSVELTERRADWIDPEAEWVASVCVRLTKQPEGGAWTLWWFDSNSKARRYDPPLFRTLGDALDEIERDPDGAFWG